MKLTDNGAAFFPQTSKRIAEGDDYCTTLKMQRRNSFFGDKLGRHGAKTTMTHPHDLFTFSRNRSSG
jgi:hypothetical protein